MTKRALVAFTLASLLIILAAAVAMRALADDSTSAQELPEPSALSHDEVLLLRAEAPALERGGLNRYPTFAEVFAAELAQVDPELAELSGRLIWGEAGCVPDENNRRATLWCAINRAEAWGGTLEQRILEPHQFHGVEIRGEVPEQFVAEAAEILALWAMSQDGWIVPRLPVRFDHFEAGADGLHNVFSTEYGGGEYWDGQEGFDVYAAY